MKNMYVISGKSIWDSQTYRWVATEDCIVIFAASVWTNDYTAYSKFYKNNQFIGGASLSSPDNTGAYANIGSVYLSVGDEFAMTTYDGSVGWDKAYATAEYTAIAID